MIIKNPFLMRAQEKSKNMQSSLIKRLNSDYTDSLLLQKISGIFLKSCHQRSLKKILRVPRDLITIF